MLINYNSTNYSNRNSSNAIDFRNNNVEKINPFTNSESTNKKYNNHSIENFNSKKFKNNKNDKNLCISLSLERNIPDTFADFGKYIIKYIGKEENYNSVFFKDSKNFKEKIKNIFEQNNQSDHCLLEYVLELWNKLEISYSIRCKILLDFCKK